MDKALNELALACEAHRLRADRAEYAFNRVQSELDQAKRATELDKKAYDSLHREHQSVCDSAAGYVRNIRELEAKLTRLEKSHARLRRRFGLRARRSK